MIESVKATAAEVAYFLQPAGQRKANPHRFNLQAIIERGTCYRIVQDGRTVGAYVLETSQDDIWITAAAGRADIDLCDVIQAEVERAALGKSRLVFMTSRAGLVAKAFKHGYRCTMTKDLR